jgi:hypothetical protein
VSDPIRDQVSLSGELGALRSALCELRAPDDESTLLSAARARAAARVVTRGPARTILAAARARVVRAARPLALAAAAAAVVVLVPRAERAQRVAQSERAVASSRATYTATATTPMTGAPAVRPAFRPISFSRRLSTAESYSVVRVRLELATIAPGAASPGAAIEADLLVGEDGLARAIRFDSADTLPVYGAIRPVSGERP